MGKKDQEKKEIDAIRFLRNAIVHQGHSPSIRELASVLGYRSPRSAMLLLNDLIERGVVRRRDDGTLQMRKEVADKEDNAKTVDVPLVGSVACGAPMLAEENIEAYVPVSTRLAKPGNKYFLLRATGDSMDKAGIEDGNLLLVRQQPVAENGEKVVALIDDEATVKEFHQEKEVVVLKPKSKNRRHQPIVLSETFVIQGVVVATLPNLD